MMFQNVAYIEYM